MKEPCSNTEALELYERDHDNDHEKALAEEQEQKQLALDKVFSEPNDSEMLQYIMEDDDVHRIIDQLIASIIMGPSTPDELHESIMNAAIRYHLPEDFL